MFNNIESALVTLIVNDINIAPILGGRLYPVTFPQEVALPAAAYQVVSTPTRFNAQSGPTGLLQKRIQYSLVDTSYSAVKALGNWWRTLLDGYRGTVGGVAIQWAWLDNESDSQGVITDNFVLRQDYLILYKEI